MGRPGPRPWGKWDDEQRAQVEGLLTAFNGDRETVCAVMGCQDEDLDNICLETWGIDFEAAVHKFELIGRARLRSALFKSAVNGNAKAIDLLSREHLDMGATLTRKAKAEREAEAQRKAEEVDF